MPVRLYIIVAALIGLTNAAAQPAIPIAQDSNWHAIHPRTDSAMFESIDQGENKPAFVAIRRTDWSKYKYATIVIPGNGPESSSPKPGTRPPISAMLTAS